MQHHFLDYLPPRLVSSSLQHPAAAAGSFQEAYMLFSIRKLKSSTQKTYNYICNIIFFIFDSQVGLQQPPASCSCHQMPPEG